MSKILMTTPIVEMDGDEMTRILWQMIKDELLLPYIDLKTEYYDLGLSMEVEPELDYVQTMVESYGYCLLEKGDIESALLLENIYDTFCVSSVSRRKHCYDGLHKMA